MKRDVIFLLIEYSGIPIALMLYSIIIKDLSNSDPISSNEDNESIWQYGLELMVITSVSTLLYAVSFYGHTNGEILSSEKKDCVIICGVVSIVEFFFLILITSKVRKWGRKDKRTKLIPNVLAGLYLAVLALLIIFCFGYAHPLSPEEISPVSSANKQGKRNFIWVILIAAVAIVIAIIYLFRFLIWKIRKRAIKDYNTGSNSLKEDPVAGIKNLQDSLKKLPDSSSLVIDIHMKLARIYMALNQNDKALVEIASLEKTSAFKTLNSYLKDGILKMKFSILLELNNLVEAEPLVLLIESKQISDKMKLALLEKKKTNLPAG